MIIARRLGLTAVLACIAVAHSFADDAKPQAAPSPAGSWSFQTKPMDYGCVLSGDMTITHSAKKSFKCQFKAVWSCQTRAPKSVTTDQTCVATQTGDKIIITSRVRRITKVDPPEMLELSKTNYAADHFEITIDAHGDEMEGLFKSYGQSPVKFRRRQDLVG
ncbi:MAG TPA: hypothetical protein PLN33_12560 [Hyphomonadaceae bacterium]|nr:hypothetical protein [Hyphomonadaceae bacterium]HPN06729.1 hypothetical protein [Hyphomonadaceae bacterium]